jgi:KaiC/GvpD/RAD55 family RecA-like ATPase
MSNDPAIERLRSDRAALEAAITTAGSRIKGTSCTCPHPAHEDRCPSASIHADTAGVWRVTCHSRACFGKGADVFDLRAVLSGRPVADLLREARGDAGSPSRLQTAPKVVSDLLANAMRCTAALTAEQRDALVDQLGITAEALTRLRLGWHGGLSTYTFPMRDEHGRVIGLRTRNADGRKRAVKGSANGLFIPADLSARDTLYIVEGPTDTAAMIDCGLSAIGRPSNNAGENLVVSYIREHTPAAVVIITDHDTRPRTAQATAAAADRLATRLVPLVGEVRVMQPPAPHKDVRAWRIAGATADDIEAVADAAPSRGPAGELGAMLVAEISGERRAIPWPWPMVTAGTQALLPGSVTLIVGDPGSGKSLWMLEALAWWHDACVPCACYAMESTRADHLRRALAQRVGASWLTEIEETQRRSDEVWAHHAEHAGWLDRFGRTLHTPGDEALTLPALAAWIEQRAGEGARVICIDPISIAETGPRPWDDAREFLRTAKRIVERAGASLILVTHPAKTRGRPAGGLRTLDDMAGGSAWARFSDCVVWLERHDEPREVTVREPSFPALRDAEVERTLRLMKVRHGRGAGWQVAVELDPRTLRFVEHGLVVKAQSSGNRCTF